MTSPEQVYAQEMEVAIKAAREFDTPTLAEYGELLQTIENDYEEIHHRFSGTLESARRIDAIDRVLEEREAEANTIDDKTD